MCLATVGEDHRPSNRYVILREVRPNGFVWFTNYDSRKGQELANNPFGALTFWWGSLERSVRIEGTVAKLTEAENNDYWAKRSRGGKIDGWYSDQGKRIESQAALSKKFEESEARFVGVADD